MDPHSRAPKEYTSYGNEVLPQDTTHLMQRHVTNEEGGRRQGRQRKRWEDNIREWTGLEFAKSERAAENWKKMEETGCEAICGTQMTAAVKG